MAPCTSFTPMVFVVDSSVAVAWMLPDEEAVQADIALDRLGEETAKVLLIFWHELRNLLLTAERRGRVTGGYADTSLTRLRRLPIRCP
ncbi:MAG: type II toxin-antitoxin system VapC family toxin [Paracoccaceae bacterium]|nr:type II toxin-antitoxin system VapC family toxin [Paracoccaceae bacterium]